MTREQRERLLADGKASEATVMAFMEALYPGHAELMLATATEREVLEEAARLLVREGAVRKALHEAATSLETISKAGKGRLLTGSLTDIRGYADSRARAAREALAS